MQSNPPQPKQADVDRAHENRSGPACVRRQIQRSSPRAASPAQGLDDFCRRRRRETLDRPLLQLRAGCVAATADRCRDSVRLADAAVARAAETAAASAGDELVAAEIRVALAELGKVVGTVYTDDLLDRIFKTFCIGK